MPTNRLPTLLLPLLTLLVSSCGGGGSAADWTACASGTHQVMIQFGLVPPGAGAEARNSSPCNSTITVLAGLSEGQTAAILVHELWHSAGFVGMHNPEGCYTAPAVTLRLPEPPCEVELQQMQSRGSKFNISVADEGLVSATRSAVDFWNEQVGRQMFVYE